MHAAWDEEIFTLKRDGQVSNPHLPATGQRFTRTVNRMVKRKLLCFEAFFKAFCVTFSFFRDKLPSERHISESNFWPKYPSIKWVFLARFTDGGGEPCTKTAQNKGWRGTACASPHKPSSLSRKKA